MYSKLKTEHFKRRYVLKHTQDPFGAVVTPTTNTTTFQANSAANLKLRFQWLLGLVPEPEGDHNPFIYGRFDTPSHRSLYKALVALEPGAISAAAFPSGMSAIYTTVKALTKQGDTILYTNPIYGCTDDYFRQYCPRDGVKAVAIDTTNLEVLEAAIVENRQSLRIIFIETPSNPIIKLSSIRKIADLAAKYPGPDGSALIIVDNTFLGPFFQHPFEHGADIIIYSATKFLGGFSSLLGGVVLTKSEMLMRVIRLFQNTTGPVFTPAACTKLEESIQTVDYRMSVETESAVQIANLLASHANVEFVYYPGLLTGEQTEIYAAQCTGPGSIISFLIKGGEAQAFAFVDRLEIILGNTVSLGGVHSYAIVPASSTHLGVPEKVRLAAGVKPNLIRLSIGKEPIRLLEKDILSALG